MLESEPEIDESIAKTKLTSGDLPEATQEYQKLLAIDPTNEDAATGAAYMAMLSGDYKAADGYLKAVIDASETPLPDLLMRRALIAQRAQDLTSAKSFALESGIDAGKVLAAEISLVDGGVDAAIDLFKQIQDPNYKEMVAQYLFLIESDDVWLQSLAEAQAQWAIGEKEFAVEDAPASIQRISHESYPQIEDLRLIWASRSLSLKKVEQAKMLLELPFEHLDDSQRWRVGATRAIIICIEQSPENCKLSFTALEESAPPEGYADAKITAAHLVLDDNPTLAVELATGFDSASAAMVLDRAGAEKEAIQAAQNSPVFSDYLKEK